MATGRAVTSSCALKTDKLLYNGKNSEKMSPMGLL